MTLYTFESTILIPSKEAPLMERILVNWKVRERPSLRLPYDHNYIINAQRGLIDCHAEEYLNMLLHEHEIIKASNLILKHFPRSINHIAAFTTPIDVPACWNDEINARRNGIITVEYLELLDYIPANDLANYWGPLPIDLVGEITKREMVV